MLLTPWISGFKRRIGQCLGKSRFASGRARRGLCRVSGRPLAQSCPRQVEPLEDRTLLSGLTISQVRQVLEQNIITGVTIVTHGFQPGDSPDSGNSLFSLAEAIRNRADLEQNGLLDDDAWLLDYDINSDEPSAVQGVIINTSTGHSVLPKGSGQSGEVVLLFDWASESNALTSGWGSAAGDALFSTLVGLGIVDPAAGPNNP